MRRYRRRRREYTPEQDKASKDLHQAEMWLNIVSSGISEQLKRDAYCVDGIRAVILHVNTDLSAAADRLEKASKSHDEAFSRGRKVHGDIVVVSPKRKKKSPRPPKPQPKTKRAANKKETAN